jgi:molecular chaperone GrpE
MLKRSEVDTDNNDTKDTDVSSEQAASGGTPPSGQPMDAASAEKLQQQLAETSKELADLKDKYLRVLADSENTRKRIRQQSEESVRLQRENFLRDLLPIVDNLERALEAARSGGTGHPIVEGVEMVLRSLLDFLRAAGVTPVNAVGQTFNPQLHEAVDQVDSPLHPPNMVINEFHRGYVIGDRTLRPARVAVTKGPAGPQGGANGGGIENR